MSYKIFIGNLTFDTSREELHEVVAQAGTVQSIEFVRSRDELKQIDEVKELFEEAESEWIEFVNNSKRFCLVEMKSEQEAKAAITYLENSELPSPPGRFVLLFGPHGEGEGP